MRKSLLVFPIVLVALVVAACGGGTSGEDGRGSFLEDADSALKDFPAPGSHGPSGEAGPQGSRSAAATNAALGVEVALLAPSSTSNQIDVIDRKIISTGFISLEVEDVESSIDEVRAIAEGLGGFVQQLSSSGDDDRMRANITIRVPQEQFFAALELIRPLGEVTSRNVGTEDVSEQFIDLDARLKSALRKEQSLLSLLGRSETVSDILTIERELERVRSDIERIQGQLGFLERRVALATIAVALFTPSLRVADPPTASLAVKVSDVSLTVDEVKALVGVLQGVVDSSSLSVRDGKERATVSFRVFAEDFNRALASLEDKGDVESKEIREGNSSNDGDVQRAEEPDARIDLSLTEGEKGVREIALALFSLLGAVVLALLGYGVSRRFRRG